MAATFAFEAELSGSGAGWTDISADVRDTPPPRWRYGLTRGNGPLELVAGAGQLTFNLRNDNRNSGATLGYYSPENASKRSGWALGIRIRVRATYLATTYTVFIGWLKTISPSSGKYAQREVACTVVDWMEWATRFPITGIATMTSTTADLVLSAIVARVPVQPVATSYDTGSDTYPYALDTSRQENSNVLTEGQRLMQSEYGRLYTKADGTLKMESRHSRSYSGTPTITLQDADIRNFNVNYPLQVTNVVRAVAYPRAVDTGLTTIFSLNGTPPGISPGTTARFICPYVDPTQNSARIGATSVATPTSSDGDFVFNSVSDGSGTNLTSSFSVTSSIGADATLLKIVNNHASLVGYPTTLRIRGISLTTYKPITTIQTSTSSVDSYGQTTITLDMKYQSDSAIADALGNWIVGLWGQPRAYDCKVTFCPNSPLNTQDLFLAAFTYDIGTSVQVVEGVNGTFTRWIDGVEMVLLSGQILEVTWYLSYGDVGVYWRLDNAAFPLGTNTALAAV